MDIEEAVKELDGCEYPNIGDHKLFTEMKEAGLVVVFGHSNDCMEFRGALYDEFYDEVKLTERGFLHNRCDEGDDCPNWQPSKNVHSVKPLFDKRPGPAWQFETSIPHRTFAVMEDGEQFQEGLVFYLADAKAIEARTGGDGEAGSAHESATA